MKMKNISDFTIVPYGYDENNFIRLIIENSDKGSQYAKYTLIHNDFTYNLDGEEIIKNFTDRNVTNLYSIIIDKMIKCRADEYVVYSIESDMGMHEFKRIYDRDELMDFLKRLLLSPTRTKSCGII